MYTILIFGGNESVRSAYSSDEWSLVELAIAITQTGKRKKGGRLSGAKRQAFVYSVGLFNGLHVSDYTRPQFLAYVEMLGDDAPENLKREAERLKAIRNIPSPPNLE